MTVHITDAPVMLLFDADTNTINIDARVRFALDLPLSIDQIRRAVNLANAALEKSYQVTSLTSVSKLVDIEARLRAAPLIKARL